MRLIIIFLLTTQFSFTQIYEAGITFGGSNFIGDVGETTFISPNKSLNGLIFKWNRSPRHSYRVSIISSRLSANDLNSKDPRRVDRGLRFETDLFEISAGMEFTFLDFNLHEADIKYTPYIYTGLVYTKYDKLAYQNNNILKLGTKSNSYGIPLVFLMRRVILVLVILTTKIGTCFH